MRQDAGANFYLSEKIRCTLSAILLGLLMVSAQGNTLDSGLPGPGPPLTFGTLSSSAAGLPQSNRTKSARALLICLSLQIDRMNASAQGSDLKLEFSSLSPSDPLNGEIYPLFDPNDFTHASNFFMTDPNFPQPIPGSLGVDLPPVDTDTNEIPDIFEIPLELAATTTLGSYGTAVDDGEVAVTWSRAAGASNGICRMQLTSAMFGELPELQGNFQVFELAGTLQYVPSTNLISAALQLGEVGQDSNVLTGTILLQRAPTNGINQLDVAPGSLTDGAAQALAYGSTLLTRSDFLSSNYLALVSFRDGKLDTSALDYFDWILWISDPNDQDANGIPDLSDQLKDKPGDSGRFTSIRKEGAGLILEWVGAGKLQAANSLTGSWVSLPLAKSPFEISVLEAGQFYRLIWIE